MRQVALSVILNFCLQKGLVSDRSDRDCQISFRIFVVLWILFSTENDLSKQLNLG